MAERISDNDPEKRDIPSFIVPLPPLITNPFMRPKPVKGTNLMELFEEDSEYEESELLQVYLRLKPCNISSSLYEVKKQCLITSADTGHGRNISKKMYTFSKIFEPDASQKEIFENVVKDNLRRLPDGHSYTLVTYGASGSGKTYTLMGTVGAPGLVPRSLEYIFKVVEAAQHPSFKPSENGAEKLSHYQRESELQWVKNLRNVAAPVRDKYRDKYRRMSSQLQSDFSAMDLTNRTNYYVWVSFVEIYNEGLYDLLVPCDRRTSSTLRIREDSSGQAYVKGASQAFVRSGEEAYDVMVAGKLNLQVAATGVHARSSRSHCIFTITLLTETENGDVRTSCVRLCDLAGSERAGHTQNTGARMQESRAINTSLHVLERCLHTLRRKQRLAASANLVPYRESKLTRLLGSGLSGARGEAVSMVVTINTDPKFASETRHVLKLAEVAKDIQVNTTAYPETTYMDSTQNTTVDTSYEMMRLRADNERLHFELVQAQSHSKELLREIDDNRQKVAREKTLLVDMAKQSCKEYYESMLAAAKERHRYEIEDIIEEYENKLAKQSVPSDGTPSKLQLLVAKLQKEIAVLEEKLKAERRARAEEVQHLKTYIAEIGLETSPEPNQDEEVLSISDDDNDDEDDDGQSEDPLNESLEPMLSTKKNASVLLQNLTSELSNVEEASENDGTFENKDNTSFREKTPKDSLNILNAVKLSLSEVQKASSEDNFYSCDTYVNNESVHAIENVAACEVSIDDKKVINDELEQIKKSIDYKRGTYTVDFNESVDSGCNFSKTNRESNEDTDFQIEGVDVESKKDSLVAGDKVNVHRESNEDTDFQIEGVDVESKKDSLVADDKVNVHRESDEETDFLIEEVDDESKRDSLVASDKVNISFKGKKTFKVPTTLLSKLQRPSCRNAVEINDSLELFEQCEKQVASNVVLTQNKSSHELRKVNYLKEKRTYFAYNKVEKAAAIPEKDPTAEKMVSQENKDYFHNFFVENVDNRVTEEVLLSKSKSCNVHENSDKKGQDTINKSVSEKKIDCVKSKSYLKEDSFGTKLSTIAKETSKCSKTKPSSEKSENEMPDNYEPTTINKLLVDSKTSDAYLLSSTNNNFSSKVHDSMDLFDDPITPKSEAVVDIQNSIRKISLADAPKIQKDKGNCDVSKFSNKMDTSSNPETTIEPNNCNNTEAEFEKLYDNVTASRSTEFDLLLTQEIDTHLCEDFTDNSTQEKKITEGKEDTNKTNIKDDETATVKKYNLRCKHDDSEWIPTKSTIKTKRTLRLRRQKVIDKDVTANTENPSEKLKDIQNLQKEFSDVTMDIPVADKIGQDIPSPEKKEDENVAPLMGTQSCSSKSVTRSRRKLFTPRAEPLDESVEQASDSNEPAKVHVPRPSYHKGRAKRKCQF